MAIMKAMNVHLEMQQNGELLVELRVKQTLLQEVKDAQDKVEELLKIKKQWRKGKIVGLKLIVKEV